MTFSLIKIKYMSLKCKNKQFINSSNRITAKTLKHIGEGFVKFSTRKYNSITPSIRSSYKTGKHIQKQEIIQLLFNQITLNVNIVVILLNNKNTTQVKNE